MATVSFNCLHKELLAAAAPVGLKTGVIEERNDRNRVSEIPAPAVPQSAA